ncbi:MAG: hypothetical protein GY777_19450 [Candidatus Brocadiaceae bacterium]|nr:hypothetical protein [Candidatus Brocadiaceae bacterium]
MKLKKLLAIQSEYSLIYTLYNNNFHSLGPTICYEGMEHVEVTPVKARTTDNYTPELFEVSPDATKETIVEIKVTDTEDKPDILYPSEGAQKR